MIFATWTLLLSLFINLSKVIFMVAKMIHNNNLNVWLPFPHLSYHADSLSFPVRKHSFTRITGHEVELGSFISEEQPPTWTKCLKPKTCIYMHSMPRMTQMKRYTCWIRFSNTNHRSIYRNKGQMRYNWQKTRGDRWLCNVPHGTADRPS